MAVLGALVLVGCTQPAPDDPTAQPSGVPSDPVQPTETEPPAAEETAEPVAVVSIAGVDVDGLGVTVGGFVSGSDSDGGRCVFELVSETTGQTAQAETAGIANGQSTSCGSAQLPTSELGRGSWSVTLRYTSPAYTLVSEPLLMEIP